MITANNLVSNKRDSLSPEVVKKLSRTIKITNKSKITKSYLHQRLSFIDGVLYWKRTSLMPDKWNKQYAGHRAGSSGKIQYIKLNGKSCLTKRIIWIYHNGPIKSQETIVVRDPSKPYTLDNLFKVTKNAQY